MKVVAQSIETAEQATMLTEPGYAILRGYLISYPLNAVDASLWLRAVTGVTHWPDSGPQAFAAVGNDESCVSRQVTVAGSTWLGAMHAIASSASIDIR
jgi:hypothetical protein